MESGQHREGSERVGSAIALTGLYKSFDGTTVLRDVNLMVAAGEVRGLIGSNGSGKSTLIKVLSGFHKFDELKSFSLDGVSMDSPDFRTVAARHFAFVHQDRCLIPELTIAENCALTMGTPTKAFGKIDRRRERAQVAQVLQSVGIVANPSAKLSSLGPAQATLLAIGRAVASIAPGGGSVLVLDEPTTALPESEVAIVLQTIRQIADRGIGVLFVSHRLNEILDVCDSVTVLRDGAVVSDQIVTDNLTADRLVEQMLGHALVKQSQVREEAIVGVPILDVVAVSGPRVTSTSFDIAPGEVVGVTGLVGCGKSELGRLIAGQQLRGGRITLSGVVIAPDSPRASVAAGIAYVPSERLTVGSLPDLTAMENVTLPDLASFTANGRLSARREKEETTRWMEVTGTVPARATQIFRQFSGGNQQKIVISKWLRLNPKVLLIDEPTQGVDVGAKEDLYRLIREAADKGTAVIVISSEPEEIARLSTRAFVMDRGAIVSEFRGSQITIDSLSEAIFSGRQIAS
jgi:ribose transport system ATP-binding protein